MIDKKKNNFACTPQSFGKLTKDPICAMLLGQLYFWGLTESEWFDRTKTEIFNITAISARQQDTARFKLEEMGFIEVDLKGIPARLFYKINFENIELAHEMIGFKLPEYRAHKNAQLKKTTSYREKNLATERNSWMHKNAKVEEQSTNSTYSLTGPEKINPKTLETARQVCVKLEAMGIDRLPSADDPELLFEIECGASVAQFESSATYAIEKDGDRSNFNYVMSRIRYRRENVASMAEKYRASGNPKSVYQGSSTTPSHASHIETPSEPLKRAKAPPSALAMLEEQKKMFSMPRCE